MPEEKIKQEAAVEVEESTEIKAIDEKLEPEKELLKSKAVISLPMTGATEAWMDDDDNFGGFSSLDDDQVAKDEVANTMSEEKIKQEAAVEVEESVEIKAIDEIIEQEKEVLERKEAISLPMTGATEAWMDDDDNFGGFSSSNDDPVNEEEMPKAMQETNIKEEAAVEIEESAEIKATDEKIEPEKEVLESKAAISLPMTGATEAWMEVDLGIIESNKEIQSLQLLNISENWMDDVATTIDTNIEDEKQ